MKFSTLFALLGSTSAVQMTSTQEPQTKDHNIFHHQSSLAQTCRSPFQTSLATTTESDPIVEDLNRTLKELIDERIHQVMGSQAPAAAPA